MEYYMTKAPKISKLYLSDHLASFGFYGSSGLRIPTEGDLELRQELVHALQVDRHRVPETS